MSQTTTTKRRLRGDPDRPFPTDVDALNRTLKDYVHPTHEPPWFLRIRGTNTPAERQRVENFQNPENIERMTQLGLHIPQRTFFFKGIGLERERPYIDRTVRYARDLHTRGMLVSVYVGGTMFTDYFFKEVPEAREWRRRDQDGLPVTYGGYQLMRWFPCLNHPGYRAYVKRVLDVAVREVEADEIFFDNQILRHEPRSCRCEYCVAHVRRLVRERYTPEQCLERYGVAEHPDVEPPVFSQACKPWRIDRVIQPQQQDWIDHRVASVIEFYRDMAGHVKRQKPDCAVGMNIKGVFGHNRAFDHGISHGEFAGILDFTCIDGYNPGYRDGVLHSEVRLYKSSHSTRISVVDGGNRELMLAEDQVHGYRKFIAGHGWLNEVGGSTLFTPMAQFFRGRQRLFHERTHLHDVAVLRTRPSTDYNCQKVHEQLMPFEQALIVEKVPWGIIFDGQKDDLGRHRIVAIPEMQAISDAWLDRLDAFMRAGGGVIASGQAAVYDAWYRQREPARGLARWLGHAPRREYETVAVGKGRFVYVPEWSVQTRWDMSDWFAIWGANVYPVLNRDTFRQALRDAAGGRPLAFAGEGPDPVLVEAIAAPGGTTEGVDLHVVNYDATRHGAGCELKLAVALPAGRSGARVTVTDAHREGHPSCEVPVVRDGDAVRFAMTVPPVYGLAQVAFV